MNIDNLKRNKQDMAKWLHSCTEGSEHHWAFGWSKLLCLGKAFWHHWDVSKRSLGLKTEERLTLFESRLQVDQSPTGPWIGCFPDLVIKKTWSEQAQKAIDSTGSLDDLRELVFGLLIFYDSYLAHWLRQNIPVEPTAMSPVFQARLHENKLVPLPGPNAPFMRGIFALDLESEERFMEDKDPRETWFQNKWWPQHLKGLKLHATTQAYFFREFQAVVHVPLHMRVVSFGEVWSEPWEQPPKLKLVAIPTCFQDHMQSHVRQHHGDGLKGRPGFVLKECKPPQWVETLEDKLKNSIRLPDFEHILLVLPELTVFEPMRRRLQQALANHDFLMIAGSGHISSQLGLNANRSCLCHPSHPPEKPPRIYHLKRDGVEVVRNKDDIQANNHSLTDADFAALPDTVRLEEILETRGGTAAHPLIGIDTPWGRISFMICKDLLSDDPEILDTLKLAKIDHLIVVSLEPKNSSGFLAAGKKLTDYHMATYVVNAPLPDRDPNKIFDHMVFLPCKNGTRLYGDKLSRAIRDGHSGFALQQEPGGPEILEIDLSKLIQWIRSEGLTTVTKENS